MSGILSLLTEKVETVTNPCPAARQRIGGQTKSFRVAEVVHSNPGAKTARPGVGGSAFHPRHPEMIQKHSSAVRRAKRPRESKLKEETSVLAHGSAGQCSVSSHCLRAAEQVLEGRVHLMGVVKQGGETHSLLHRFDSVNGDLPLP